MRALALAASALLLSAAPSPAQQQQQRAPAEIAEAHRRLEQAFNRGDAAAVAALYTEDATLLPPGGDILSGRRAAQARWQAAYDTGARNLSLAPVSVETWGDAAREIGRFTLEAPGQGGQTARVEGKYVAVWKNTADGWRLDTDIWNLNR
jgi:uncharacterized protein (TIGR02246 family)